MENATKVGAYMIEKLRGLEPKHPCIGSRSDARRVTPHTQSGLSGRSIEPRLISVPSRVTTNDTFIVPPVRVL